MEAHSDVPTRKQMNKQKKTSSKQISDVGVLQPYLAFSYIAVYHLDIYQLEIYLEMHMHKHMRKYVGRGEIVVCLSSFIEVNKSKPRYMKQAD